MDNNEAFEKWFWNDNLDDYNKPKYEMGLRAWQAAQQQSAGEIAELKAIIELDKDIEAHEITELKADNERLREALKDADELIGIEPFEHVAQEAADAHYAIREALSATTSQPLQAHESEQWKFS